MSVISIVVEHNIHVSVTSVCERCCQNSEMTQKIHEYGRCGLDAV